MGIVFSDTIDKHKDKDEGEDGLLFSKAIVDRGKLRLPSAAVQALVETYSNHYYLPVSGRAELWSLFSTALGSSFQDMNIIFSTCWKVFSKEGLCKTQEVLVCLALLCDANWRTRLSHIFDIFKSTCTNEIFNEDIMLGLEVVMQALLSLWSTTLKVETDRDEFHTITEEVAVAAFDKLGKSPDDGILRNDFLLWAAERFKDSKTVANEDALLRIYRMQ